MIVAALYIVGAVLCFFVFSLPILLLAAVVTVAIFHRTGRKRHMGVESSTVMRLDKNQMLVLMCGVGVVVVLSLYTVVFFLGAFAYWPSPHETPCAAIPEGTVAIAVAFTPAGKNGTTGKYIPGGANVRIAAKLEQCADRFQLVLTQKAVSDALDNEKALRDGTPVEQMHIDNERNVRTWEAISCAVDRLEQFPPDVPLGLVAHDKHLGRARHALEAVLEKRRPGAPVVAIHLGETPYQSGAFYLPWWWAARELLFAWPSQYWLVHRGALECSGDVAISDPLMPVESGQK